MRNWRRNRMLIALYAAILLIASGCGTLSTATTTTTIATPYDDAVALMENGDYEAAIEAFEALTDAEDADQKIIECQYALGLEAMEDGEWEKAISYFAVLDYSDSADKIIECQYALGLEAMEESRWSTAISFLSNLEYEDSATKVLECQYNQGLEAMASSDWILAIEYFTGLSYEDSETRIAECNYYLGLEAIEAGNLELAISYLDQLDYEDAADQAAACKYQLGNSALEAEEWETAINYFENLDYADSTELLEYCTREKGMHENADYDFLADLEASILNRLENIEADADKETLVNTELAYLEKYAGMNFYDADIEALAVQYLEGLYVQSDSLQEKYNGDFEIEWYRGLVLRLNALNELYETYDFMSDDIDFVANYILQVDEYNMYYEASVALGNCVQTVVEEIDSRSEVDASKKKFYVTFDNDTEFSFDLYATMYFYSDGVLFETSSTSVSNVESGFSCELTFSLNDPWRVDYIILDCWLDDVSRATVTEATDSIEE